MATTAKGLRYPLATDPAAAHTDLQNIATDFANASNQLAVSAKGDVLTHNGTFSTALAVGTAGQILSVDTTTATGLKWITPTELPSQTMEIIASGYSTVSYSTATYLNADVSFASIPSTYKDLSLSMYVGYIDSAGIDNNYVLRLNGTAFSTALEYTAGTGAASLIDVNAYIDAANIALNYTQVSDEATALGSASGKPQLVTIKIYDYANTNLYKNVVIKQHDKGAGTTSEVFRVWSGIVQTTAAITAVSFSQNVAGTGIAYFSIGSHYVLHGIKGS